jgi:hypothetical protein
MNEEKADQGGNEKLLEFFCRHLVALCVTYREVRRGVPAEKTSFSAYPGIVLSVRGMCSFLTAGHALKDLSDHLEKGEIIVESAVLADTFGPGTISEKPIPFDLKNEPLFFIDDEKEGLDFGLVALRPYYAALLERHGIVAVFEENWINQGKVQFDAYAMLGLPEEFITSGESSSGDGSLIGRVAPTMIGVKAADLFPEDVRSTTYPRFTGQLNDGLPLTSIVGMSGGPIFGFRYGPPATYWVVAIQSSWLKNKSIVFGCPLPVLAGLLTEWIDALSKSEKFQPLNKGERDKDL